MAEFNPRHCNVCGRTTRHLVRRGFGLIAYECQEHSNQSTQMELFDENLLRELSCPATSGPVPNLPELREVSGTEMYSRYHESD